MYILMQSTIVASRLKIATLHPRVPQLHEIKLDPQPPNHPNLRTLILRVSEGAAYIDVKDLDNLIATAWWHDSRTKNYSVFTDLSLPQKTLLKSALRAALPTVFIVT